MKKRASCRWHDAIWYAKWLKTLVHHSYIILVRQGWAWEKTHLLILFVLLFHMIIFYFMTSPYGSLWLMQKLPVTAGLLLSSWNIGRNRIFSEASVNIFIIVVGSISCSLFSWACICLHSKQWGETAVKKRNWGTVSVAHIYSLNVNGERYWLWYEEFPGSFSVEGV